MHTHDPSPSSFFLPTQDALTPTQDQPMRTPVEFARLVQQICRTDVAEGGTGIVVIAVCHDEQLVCLPTLLVVTDTDPDFTAATWLLRALNDAVPPGFHLLIGLARDSAVLNERDMADVDALLAMACSHGQTVRFTVCVATCPSRDGMDAVDALAMYHYLKGDR
jgi:hypothetical protein